MRRKAILWALCPRAALQPWDMINFEILADYLDPEPVGSNRDLAPELEFKAEICLHWKYRDFAIKVRPRVKTLQMIG